MEISPKSIVKNYVRHHYGGLISVEEPKFNPVEKQWIAELISDYPRIIHNDRHPQERMLRFLTLRGLGTVKVGANLAQNSIEATTRDDLVENLNGYLSLWEERANRAIIKASSINLARTTSAQIFLGKIGVIISRLQHMTSILDSELEFFPQTESFKMRRYLQLLESLGIVEHKQDEYSYGNMYTELCNTAQKYRLDLNTAVLAYIIKNRYFALRETFGITQLEPEIHVDSLYYRPALEADELIYWKYSSFEHRCRMVYGNKSKISFRLPFILDELVNVETLRYEDGMYFGNSELWKEMRESIESSEFSFSRA